MSEMLIFSKERTIGQTISFAFLIFRKNSKNFWKGMALAVLPWILGAVALVAPFIIGWANGNSINWGSFVGPVILAILMYMFGFLVLNTFVNEYIIAVKNDAINQKPHYKGIVKATYKAVPKNILNFFLLTILWFMMSTVLYFIQYIFMLIIIAGIASGSVLIIGLGSILYMIAYFASLAYLCICTGPIIFIGQYEKVHFFKALELNFSYVHARKGFWTGILVSLFGFILMYVISINVAQPIWITYGVIEYNSGSLSAAGPDKILTIVGLVYLTLGVTWPLSSFIMMMIFGANYFGQKERAIGSGLNERVSTIGENKDYDSSKLEADF